jgi:hypothetical protein
MSLEAAVVLSPSGEVLHWHFPPGRTVAGLPDSSDLWIVLWRERARLGGVAHTHPGRGIPSPSHEDVTTFAACEAALGSRLDWWIATEDSLVLYRWVGPGRLDYRPSLPRREQGLGWLEELRELSRRSPP